MIRWIFTLKRGYKLMVENVEYDSKRMYLQRDLLWMLNCEMYKSRPFSLNQQKDQEFSLDLSGALKVTHNV